MNENRLPLADKRQVRRAAWALLRGDAKALTMVIVLYCLAAVAGLAAPWLLGEIVDRVDSGAGIGTVDMLGLAIAGFLLAQLLFDRFGRYLGYRYGERALARMREDFIDDTLRLPVSVVERAGSGDLMTRSTGDVNTLGTIVRQALPEMVIAAAHIVFILGAVIVLNPLFSLCALLMILPLWLIMRWYLRRARSAYLAEGDANTEMSEVMAATAAGAKTVEAFGLADRRVAAGDATVAEGTRTRRKTLWLRTVMFPVADFSYVLPMAAALFFGGLLYFNDVVSLGVVIAASLYLRQLVEPLDQALMWIEQLQQGGASFARVRGVAEVEPDRVPSGDEPVGDTIEVTGVHYAYTSGRDVLHGIDLSVRAGEHLAVVGPSGAGKSTLGRLLAGVDAPRVGAVKVGGVAVTDLDQAELRRRIALVTQDHHVFIGTVRDNLILAKPTATDDEVLSALGTVGATWLDTLPEGLDTQLGAGHTELDAPQAQQIALARLVLADPHTLILDEATSLLDPTAAREAERALAAVLHGRTVIAIAHRLHAAHDADRVAIVDGGRITELGSHDELVAAGGSYAALWRSWHGETD
ncbi:ABC transporter ATP-binding protein [Stackebrandtia nassauensis]|uniref:ABC transporter related protein n=1 Tax=Stackebrandtia nassauensis (strain DSM 44728 / CIP 108903 / NRRL B-16338 / NBRC 102104 / LLR-40K-21) TaxID=446470 RepID=D3Q4H7_STANL|nr:ABC transporter ATP-binding protein [Stackebrandtia nassauensis]ADD40137.1 ABC transporter related protein [Stackebrandtia nassauensis DSM 44728]